MKFIVVTGGVISGVGKGIVSSAIALLLKAAGIKVNSGKVDPYLNRDAGTMNPFEHGECFVLDDGMEADLDLGNYERFLERNLTKDSSITTGQIYHEVLCGERAGNYLGKTVQIIPHITGEIIRRFELLLDGFDVVVIELGGTVGDIESEIFYHALQRMHHKYGRDEFCYVHVGPLIKTHGNELKTKAIQHSVRELNQNGIVPDYLCIRLPDKLKTIDSGIREKLSYCCKRDIILSPNCDSVYYVPQILYDQLADKIFSSSNFDHRYLTSFSNLGKTKRTDKKVIAVIGKYLNKDEGSEELTDKSDAYLSLRHAIDHASMYVKGELYELMWFDAENINFFQLEKCDGMIITGGFGDRGYDGMIKAANFTRNSGIPTLGICLGFQMMVIEYARHLGFDADTREKNSECKFPIIDLQESSRTNSDKGGTLRKGSYLVKSTGTIKSVPTMPERFRHRYHLDRELADIMSHKSENVLFDGCSDDLPGVSTRFSLKNHKFYLATQAHCELTSRLNDPSVYFVELMKQI